MIKKILLSVMIFNLYYQSIAQGLTNTSLKFKEIIFDYGIIKEDNGPVSHDFSFINYSSKPILISEVKASCGCTTPNWTKDTINPNKEGIITAVYDPHNRPGPFSKTLTVFAINSSQPVILTIKGIVNPKPKSPADEYPDKLGSLRMSSRYMFVGDITTEKKVTKEFEIYNDGNTGFSLVEPIVKLDFMTITMKPSVLKPKEKGKFIVEYNPLLKGDFGYLIDKIIIKTSDEPTIEKTIFVSSTVKPYFAPLTESQKNEAPKIVFEKEYHDFGSVKEGEKVSTSFIFTNKGKQDLIIYKAKATCGCTATDPESKILKPGTSSKINVIFDTKDKEGNQEKQVYIYCNDPQSPSNSLLIKAVIIK